MGFMDRDYWKEESWMQRWTPKLTYILLAINAGVFFLIILLESAAYLPVSEFLGLCPEKVVSLELWRLITYAFVHTPGHIFYMLINMLMLYMFGKEIENLLGARRYILFYILSSIFAALCACIYAYIIGKPAIVMSAWGGSGAPVTAIIVLFTFIYPRQTVLFFFIIPMKMWVCTAIFIAFQIVYAIGYLTTGLIPILPLAGAGFGAGWFYLEPVIDRLKVQIEAQTLRKQRQRVRDLKMEVDRILDKISKHGMASLTPREKKILRKASKVYSQHRD